MWYLPNLSSFVFLGGIELEQKKTAAIKDELEATMNELLDMTPDAVEGNEWSAKVIRETFRRF